jgi:hypothetical protein
MSLKDSIGPDGAATTQSVYMGIMFPLLGARCMAASASPCFGGRAPETRADSKLVNYAVSVRGFRERPVSVIAFSFPITSEFSCVADAVADGAGSNLEVRTSAKKLVLLGMTLGSNSITACIICKGIPSATPSATPKNMSTHRQISVDKMCYEFARFGRQKAMVIRKYGHDTQGVTGSSPVRPTTVRPTTVRPTI